jgi:hypothetical protein
VVPVPLNATLWGELDALSVRVMAAVNVPAVPGAKRTPIVHFAPAARLEPQVFEVTNEEVSAPVSLMLLIARATVPPLVKVTACAGVESPTSSLPKDMLVVESDAWTFAAVKPVVPETLAL